MANKHGIPLRRGPASVPAGTPSPRDQRPQPEPDANGMVMLPAETVVSHERIIGRLVMQAQEQMEQLQQAGGTIQALIAEVNTSRIRLGIAPPADEAGIALHCGTMPMILAGSEHAQWHERAGGGFGETDDEVGRTDLDTWDPGPMGDPLMPWHGRAGRHREIHEVLLRQMREATAEAEKEPEPSDGQLLVV